MILVSGVPDMGYDDTILPLIFRVFDLLLYIFLVVHLDEFPRVVFSRRVINFFLPFY